MPGSMELRRISASTSPATGIRWSPQVAKLIDTTTCIGCKACEVACQEWNDLLGIEPAERPVVQLMGAAEFGSYQTQPDLTDDFWNLIRFNEHVEKRSDGSEKFHWLMAKDQCMHCDDPGCLQACPAPNAIVQYANGVVDFQQEHCIGCEYCVTGCPFDIPRLNRETRRVYKCTLCSDRLAYGLEPACIKACPTGCLQFGTKEQLVQIATARVEQLKANDHEKAAVYDPPGVGGTGVIYVLALGDRPELYGLPKDPRVPLTVTVWKNVLKPIGSFAIAGALFGAAVHYLRYGRNEVPATGRQREGEPEIRQSQSQVSARARIEEDVAVNDLIIRHKAGVRLTHWLLAIFFMLSLLTGVALYTPYLFGLSGLVGGGAMARFLHPWFSLGFFIAVALLYRSWRTRMRKEPGDDEWRKNLGRYLRNEVELHEVGKYNAGQKFFFRAVALGTLALLASGVVMWFPTSFPLFVRAMAYWLHVIVFVAFVIGVIYHIYMSTAAMPGTLRAMTRGTVTREWARWHHRRWYREVTGEEEE